MEPFKYTPFQYLLARLSAVICLLSLSGCASTTLHTPVDFCAQPVDPLLARMVVTRTGGMVGAAATIRIYDNDQPIGDIGPDGKICWNRYPGVAVVRGEVHGRKVNEFNLYTVAEANNTYYSTIGFGWTGPMMEHAKAPGSE